jgi:putative SOS response-associated peptidase YedK
LKVHQFILGDHEACSVLLRSIDRHPNFDDVRQALNFAFLTTESNEVVKPIHAKAMPVLFAAAT